MIHAIIDTLADAAGVCAKLIDEADKVVAVNRRGAALIGKPAEEICGDAWSGLWDGASADEAQAALDIARSGTAASFTGTLAGDDTPRAVRTLPLMSEGTGVQTVLALTSQANPHDHQIVMALPSALHAFANLANVSASSARLLKRGLNEEMTGQLAGDLGNAAERASTAIETLRDLIDRDQDPPEG
ncbi:MAG: hypothetical protein VX874_20980 [Pseudomonadota bacterium]|nr:hypothetical protein [Pseudomonadota bacterium]